MQLLFSLFVLGFKFFTIDKSGNTELFGIDLIKEEDFINLIFRFLFNAFFAVIIVRYIYYPAAKRKDYLFTYILISMVVFLLCFSLNSVKLELGFALGLFAIFGILRYRTDAIPIKEMTYLFVIIGLAVVNALANKKVSYAELIFTNVIILSVCYGLERMWLLKHESLKTIVYEKIDLIHPSKRADLQADLEQRTGMKINRIEIGNIDFLRDTAQVKIYYFEKEQEIEPLAS